MTPPIVEWSDPSSGLPIRLLAALREDLRAHVPSTEQGGGWLHCSLRTLKTVATSSGLHLSWNYRLSHTIRGRWGLLGRPLALGLFWWGRHFYGCSIAPTARLHGGLILPHPQGIVVGPGVEVGPRAWIFQNVTLGGAPDKAGSPTIGADARIYAGAVLSGPIALGDNVVIGANAVVHRNVPSRSVVRSARVDVVALPGCSLVESLDGLDVP